MRDYIVQFADEVDDGESPRYFRAYQLPSGRWHVRGVDRWDYEASELIFRTALPER